MARTTNTLKTDTAREYRTQYGKEKPAKALARIMYNENKLLFKDIEEARDKLRYIEGKKGKKSVKNVKDKSFIISEDRPRNPYNLPESDETSYEPFVLKGHKRIALFSDIHVPYHSIEALTAAITFCKKEKPDALILNGDTVDIHSLSKFVKDPRKKNFKLELDITKSLIETFQKELKCKLYFKLGNHEERYQQYLWMKAGELVGIEEFDFENIIKARTSGVTIISDKRYITIGNLSVLHGHEFGGNIFNPVNIARGLFLKAKVSAIQGHNHQVSEHTEPNLHGKIITTWSTGCLCELHPAYLPINKWSHGFAIVDIAGDDFELRNKRIYKGKIL